MQDQDLFVFALAFLALLQVEYVLLTWFRNSRLYLITS